MHNAVQLRYSAIVIACFCSVTDGTFCRQPCEHLRAGRNRAV